MNKALKSLMKSHKSLKKVRRIFKKSPKTERQGGLGFIGVEIFERERSTSGLIVAMRSKEGTCPTFGR